MPELKLTITDDRLKCLLVGALEGGSNYWYQIIDHAFPAGVNYADFSDAGEFTSGRFTDKANYYQPEEIIRVTEGCATLIQDSFGDHRIGVWLNRHALLGGLQLLLKNFGVVAGRILAEDDDASDADIVLQLAVYGEVVYG